MSLNEPDWVELEKLVDGQLSSTEYRELIERIEDHPQGWRKCAMAFLEDQALKKELGALGVGLGQTELGQTELGQTELKQISVVGQANAVSEKVSLEPSSKSTKSAWSMQTWGALAASLVFAFCFGALIDINWRANQKSIAQEPDDVILDPKTWQEPVNTLVSTDTEPTGNLKMTFNAPGQEKQSLEVPIFDGEKQAEHYIKSVDRPIPNRLINILNDPNFKFEQNSIVVPIQHESGQWMLVPIEQLNVSPKIKYRYQ